MTALRWVLLLPVAFALGEVASTVARITAESGTGRLFGVETFLGQLSTYGSSGFAFGAVTVFVGTKIAPGRKVGVAKFPAWLLVGLSAMNVVASIGLGDEASKTPLQASFDAVATVVTAFVARALIADKVE